MYHQGLEEVVESLQRSYSLSVMSGDKDGERKNLQTIFGANVGFFFEQSPQQKLNYIQNLQQKGETVLMMGDGLNDAGALRQADIGMAISEDVEHFSPACDVIVTADQFSHLADFILLSKK